MDTITEVRLTAAQKRELEQIEQRVEARSAAMQRKIQRLHALTGYRFAQAGALEYDDV